MTTESTTNRGGTSSHLFRINRILVPTDFSDCARKALQYALPLARQFGAEIVLVFAVQPAVPVPELGAIDAELLLTRMRESGENELAALQASIACDVKVRTEMRVGRPDHEIINAAEELNADIIVLSTHGRTGMGRVLLGSVTEHVTRHAHCPVLVVREREHDFVRESSGTTAAELGSSPEFVPHGS